MNHAAMLYAVASGKINAVSVLMTAAGRVSITAAQSLMS